MVKARMCGRCGEIVVGDCDCRAERRQRTSIDGYDRRWQRFRKQLLRERAREGRLLCGMCGRVFGAESPHADHIMPVISQDDPLFFEPTNIQFLHPACHGEKTARDVREGRTR